MQDFYNDAFMKEIEDCLASLAAEPLRSLKAWSECVCEEDYLHDHLAYDPEGSFEASPEELRAAALKRSEEQFETFGSDLPF